MKFQTLTIESTKQANIPKEFIPFRWLAHHVKEIFMVFLPELEINDSSKIEISFGHRGEEVVFDNVLGVTNYFIEDFDFLNFYSLPRREQELTILEAIKNSLLTICKKKSGDNLSIVNAIELAANEVINIGFNLQIPIKKLGKKSSDKKYEVNVYRILNAEVGEAWSCIIKNKAANFSSEKWMTKVPDYLDRKNFFKKAEIKNDVYTVFNAFGKPVFQIHSLNTFSQTATSN